MGKSVSSSELVDRLRRAHGGSAPKGIIATDGDGTLWRGDIGNELFLVALRGGAFREVARGALLVEAADHQIDMDPASDVNDIARRLFEEMLAGRYDEPRAFAMMAWVFAGWTAAELADHSRQVLDDFGFDAAVRSEVRPVLAWARAQAVPVWLVTASPLAVSVEAAKRLGLDPEQVVAMEPAMTDGVVQPRLGKPATCGDGKLVRLKEATDAPLLAAFGDTSYDAAMLRVAEVPVAVCPNSQLRALAPQLPGLLMVGDR